MAAIAIYRGARHVVEYVSEENAARIGDTEYVRGLISHVFIMGQPVVAHVDGGDLWVIPLMENDDVVAVATHFSARPPLQLVRPVAPARPELAG